MPLYLPGPGPRQNLRSQTLPLTAYETAIAALGPAAAWRLQEADPGDGVANLEDQFTGTDATLLSAHSADSGHSWTLNPALTATSEIKSNRIAYTSGGAGDSAYYSSDTPSTADYAVEAKLRCISTGSLVGAGVRVRMDTAVNTAYQVIYLGVANQWLLQRVVTGTATSIAPVFAEALAANDERIVRLEVSGSRLRVFIDGTLRIAASDTTITAAGRPGVIIGGGSPTTAYHLDYVRGYKTADVLDSVDPPHNGTAIGTFTLNQDGFAVGEGALATESVPANGGYARITSYQPFAQSSNRTFVGLARLDSTTDIGPQVLFGSRGGVDGTTQPVCVLEAVYESGDSGYTRMHYVSNVEVMSVFADRWDGVVPKTQWFHWAFTVVDTGSGNQTYELFINGVNQGPGIAPTGFNQPTFSPNAGDYLIGQRGQQTAESTAGHAVDGAHGMQAVYNSILTPSQIQNLARTAGFFATGIPLDPANIVSSATLDLTVPAGGVNVPLDPASIVCSATLFVTAQTKVVLGTSSIVSSATLAVTAQTQVPLGASSIVSSATLALTAKTTVVLGAASIQSSASLNLAQYVPLQTASIVTSATLALTAQTKVVLGASSVVSSATLALTAPTQIPLGASSIVSSATAFVTAQTYIPLGASSIVSSATLTVYVPSSTVPCAPANIVTSATLAFTAKTTIPLGASSGVASATLALTATTRVVLQTSSALTSASLLLTVPQPAVIPLQAASALLSATLAVSIGIPRWGWEGEDNWDQDPQTRWNQDAELAWAGSGGIRWPMDNEGSW